MTMIEEEHLQAKVTGVIKRFQDDDATLHLDPAQCRPIELKSDILVPAVSFTG